LRYNILIEINIPQVIVDKVTHNQKQFDDYARETKALLECTLKRLEEITPAEANAFPKKHNVFKAAANVRYEWNERPRARTPQPMKPVKINFSGPGAEVRDIPIIKTNMSTHQPIKVLLNNYVSGKLYPSQPSSRQVHQWTSNRKPATGSEGMYPSMLEWIPTKIVTTPMGTYDLAKPFVIPSISRKQDRILSFSKDNK
jgi:hypothetical protein